MARAALAVVVTAIAVLTLRPTRPSVFPLPFLCLACGDLGGVDFILNVALFVPLGVCLVRAGASWTVAAGIGLLFTAGIEGLQHAVIPGRDASLSDLMANTLGATMGALGGRFWRRLAAPAPDDARLLSAMAATLGIGVLAATAALLRPAIPDMGLWGQWTPQQLHFEPYTGRVTDFRVNDIRVPYNLVPESEPLRQRLLTGETHARLEFTAGAPTARLSAVGRVGSRAQEVLLLGVSGNDLVFRTRLAAQDWRLRAPGIALPNAIPSAGTTVVAEAGLRANHWYVRVAHEFGEARRNVPFAVSLGWAMLLPFDHPLHPADRWWSALWLAMLALPAATWGAMARSPRARRLGVDSWWLLVTGLLGLGLAAIPPLAGFASASGSEWMGLLAGAVAGAAVAPPLQRVAQRDPPGQP